MCKFLVRQHVKYDNLKSAVTAVLFGTDRRRTENDRWVLFRSHYQFDDFIACRASQGPTRRVASRAKAAGSGATIWSRCRR
jgi:hypothetical protein